MLYINTHLVDLLGVNTANMLLQKVPSLDKLNLRKVPATAESSQLQVN